MDVRAKSKEPVQHPRKRRVAPRLAELADADEAVRQVIWGIFAIASHFEDIRRQWANLVGVSGPQWLILMAVGDEGTGTSVGEVWAKLHVNSTFITAQAKALEEAGYLARRPSKLDGRVVLLSLTEKARRELGRIATHRREINDFIFGPIGKRGLTELVSQIDAIQARAEKAAALIKMES